MPKTQDDVVVRPTAHWFSDDKEVVSVNVSTTLPRVGRIKARFHADRYVALFDEGSVRREKWTDWRIVRENDSIDGVGPKTLDVLRESAEPAVNTWLASDDYASSRRKEIARFIAREAKSKYGTEAAKKAISKYEGDLPTISVERLKRAIACLDEAEGLLNDL